MSSITASFGAARGRGRTLAERLADEALLVCVVAMFGAVISAAAVPTMLQPDSWLTFLGGREVAAHGIPHADSLTVLTSGRPWIDQQWLAQVLTYRLESAVGLGATIAVFALMVVGAFALACAYARRTASARSVAIFAVLASPAAYCALRAQTFSYVLFVPLFALLCRESRKPTRRVWLALPVLALWANLHGAVIVAAALVALLGAGDLVQRRVARGAGLIVGASVSLLATPYGFGILAYYRSTIDNPLFKKFITEWSPPTALSWIGLPFFLSAALAIAVIARRPRVLTPFETSALGLTLAGGALAQRSVIWFAFAAILLLPRVLDDNWPARRTALLARGFVTAAAGLAILLALVLAATSVRAAGRRIEAAYPSAATRAVAAALAADPKARVLADARTSDWLLYRLPELRGRIAFDDRWELLSQPNFGLVRDFLTQSAPGAARLTRGYRIFVVYETWHRQLTRWYATRRDLRVLYRGDRVAVYERS